MTLQRRTPLRSRKVWRATENGSKRTLPGNWRRIREACRDRSAGLCQAGIPGVCEGERPGGHPRPVYGHAHHLKRRGQGGADHLSNLAWVCGLCHGHLHHRVEWAYEVGLLRRRQDPGPYPWSPDDGCTAWDAHVGQAPPAPIRGASAHAVWVDEAAAHKPGAPDPY